MHIELVKLEPIRMQSRLGLVLSEIESRRHGQVLRGGVYQEISSANGRHLLKELESTLDHPGLIRIYNRLLYAMPIVLAIGVAAYWFTESFFRGLAAGTILFSCMVLVLSIARCSDLEDEFKRTRVSRKVDEYLRRGGRDLFDFIEHCEAFDRSVATLDALDAHGDGSTAMRQLLADIRPRLERRAQEIIDTVKIAEAAEHLAQLGLKDRLAEGGFRDTRDVQPLVELIQAERRLKSGD